MQMDVDLQDLIVPAAVTTSALALSYCVYRKMALPAPKGLPRCKYIVKKDGTPHP